MKYAELNKWGSMVLANELFSYLIQTQDFECINEMNEIDDTEVLQWFIISDSLADFIQAYTEIELYNFYELGVVFMPIRFYGVSWDFQSIPLNKKGQEFFEKEV